MSDLADLTMENFHVKTFFADFNELKDVDSKNEKKTNYYQLPTIPSLTSTDVENNNNYGGDLIGTFP